MSDDNYLSYWGDGKGNIYAPDGALLFAADVPGMREVRLGRISKPADRRVTDLLKLSGCVRLRIFVEELDASGCAEDMVDINHSEDVEVVVGDAWAGHQYLATIKGGTKNARLAIERLHTHGRETDVDLGNFSDQGNTRTTGVSLNIATVDRSPVAVRVLTAARPALENASAQAYSVDARAQGWFYTLYNFLKDILRTFHIAI